MKKEIENALESIFNASLNPLYYRINKGITEAFFADDDSFVCFTITTTIDLSKLRPKDNTKHSFAFVLDVSGGIEYHSVEAMEVYCLTYDSFNIEILKSLILTSSDFAYQGKTLAHYLNCRGYANFLSYENLRYFKQLFL